MPNKLHRRTGAGGTWGNHRAEWWIFQVWFPYRIISPYRNCVKFVNCFSLVSGCDLKRNLKLLRFWSPNNIDNIIRPWSPPKVREDGIMTYEWKSVVERDRCAVPAAPEQPACSSSALMSSSWCSHFGFKMNSTYSEPRVCCSHFSPRTQKPGVGRSQLYTLLSLRLPYLEFNMLKPYYGP